MNALPEFREADTPLEVGAIFAEVKAASGLPLVNLVRRHSAAMPCVLATSDSAARPIGGSISHGRRPRTLQFVWWDLWAESAGSVRQTNGCAN